MWVGSYRLPKGRSELAVAHALLRAVWTLVSTPVVGQYSCSMLTSFQVDVFACAFRRIRLTPSALVLPDHASQKVGLFLLTFHGITRSLDILDFHTSSNETLARSNNVRSRASSSLAGPAASGWEVILFLMRSHSHDLAKLKRSTSIVATAVAAPLINENERPKEDQSSSRAIRPRIPFHDDFQLRRSS